MHESITDCVLQAGENMIHECKTHDNQILGWNDVCKEVHANAREAFLTWTANGKPKQGPIFNTMKRSRASFKYVLRQCKANECKAKADKVAMKFMHKDSKSFWKEIKKLNGNDKNVIASTVNGVSGNSNIANMWHEYYKNLLNSTTDTVNKEFVTRHFKSCNTDDFTISPLDIREAIKDLKKGKSADLDNLTSKHYKYASDKLYVLLSIVLNCMIVHGYLPSKFMDTLLIPIVKDKKGDITDGDNYRPIAITCVASKILELVMLDRFLDKLATTSNQFGFKHGLSTDLCIFSLKQTIAYYKALSSPVYICYLDASKAFDRINHWTLCKKLLCRNIPSIAVRLLHVWYSTQLFNVQWGTSLSKCFLATNRIRGKAEFFPRFYSMYT